MSMAPGGNKYKPKAENISVKASDEPFDVSMAAVVGGLAIAKLGGMSMLGYGITAVGSIGVAMEFMRLADPWRKLFERLSLQVAGETPRKKRKIKTVYGYCIEFSLPVGLSTDNFEKNKLEIEQYLNRKIDISYKNKRVLVKVFERELDKDVPYRFVETGNVLEFAIGVKFGGEVVTLDLAKVVHLLIAGETGSGKSTLLRAIITNIVLSSKKVDLHLIDLKNGAEFNVFRRCSQVKTFSRTKEDAEDVLIGLLEEVDRRYDLFFENDVVDIKEYNELKNRKKLRYKVVIIDEFADLQDEKGSISIVESLAAKARACGIHLIISTQRPDAKILNGRIKANVPCVIGLKTMNDVNSRIILSENGLEELRGQGHGILKYSEFTEFQSMNLTVKKARELIKHTYIDKSIKKIKEKEEIGVVDNFNFLMR